MVQRCNGAVLPLAGSWLWLMVNGEKVPLRHSLLGLSSYDSNRRGGASLFPGPFPAKLNHHKIYM